VRPLARLLRSPLGAGILIAGLVGLGTLGLRGAGRLEPLELLTYDALMRLRPGQAQGDPRILLVAVDEADIRAEGRWPLPDATLAAAVEALGRHGPRAIGLDIYRDVPVPPGTAEFHAALARHENLVLATKFGRGAGEGIPPPEALRDRARAGFNDVVVDPGGIVRRGLLFLDDGTTTSYSFALRLALLYLAAEGIGPAPDPADPRHLRLGRRAIRPLEPGDGPYVAADARGYQFFLDFAGGWGAFPTVSLSRVLSGELDPAAVRDKVVIIGVAADGVKDFFYTPYSHGLADGQHIPGIAVHAHAVSQLIRMGLGSAAPLTTPSERSEAGWTLLWAALGAGLGLAVRSPWRFALSVGGGLLVLGALALASFGAGWWLPLVPPALAWLSAASLGGAYMSYRERGQRAVLMSLFSRHVSREVADTIWAQRDEFLEGHRPRPQRLTATILLTDLAGFTPLAERLSPQEFVEWLSEYLDAMARSVLSHGGVIRQYVGDSIMVVFGAPVARTTEAEIGRDARAAVDCALAMGRTLEALNRRWAAAGRPTTAMRIGIFTGPVVAGTFGSAERSEYMVVGDTVNTASRLETLDKDAFAAEAGPHPWRILIGEATQERLGSGFDAVPVGAVHLKGKAHPVRAYRVLGRAADRDLLAQGGRR
jgi:adenylate cyclase